MQVGRPSEQPAGLHGRRFPSFPFDWQAGSASTLAIAWDPHVGAFSFSLLQPRLYSKDGIRLRPIPLCVGVSRMPRRPLNTQLLRPHRCPQNPRAAISTQTHSFVARISREEAWRCPITLSFLCPSKPLAKLHILFVKPPSLFSLFLALACLLTIANVHRDATAAIPRCQSSPSHPRLLFSSFLSSPSSPLHPHVPGSSNRGP